MAIALHRRELLQAGISHAKQGFGRPNKIWQAKQG
jgi:hypothetical protein